VKSDLRRLRAIGKKEVITLTSYRIKMMMKVVNLWYFAISFYFIAEFVGDPESISGLEGGYFEFVLIGAIVTSFALVGMESFGGQISEEQNEGTLEAILATPTPMWTILVASYIVPSLFLIVEAGVLIGVGLGIFGAGIPLVGLLKAFPLLLLTTASFVPLGILSASFIILVKRGDPFSGPVRQLTLLLSGALYPISILPGWLQGFSKLVPATYGVRATRELVQGDAGLGDVTFEMLVLVAFAVTAMPLAVLVFRRAVTVARRAGTLATY
jgi:ABC-2 type transport system permease protein